MAKTNETDNVGILIFANNIERTVTKQLCGPWGLSEFDEIKDFPITTVIEDGTYFLRRKGKTSQEIVSGETLFPPAVRKIGFIADRYRETKWGIKHETFTTQLQEVTIEPTGVYVITLHGRVKPIERFGKVEGIDLIYTFRAHSAAKCFYVKETRSVKNWRGETLILC